MYWSYVISIYLMSYLISDADVPNGLCIDLTNGNEDFIDLTSPAPSGTNDASVIVVSL